MMSMFKRRHARPSKKLRLQLEPLEARETPAVAASLTPAVSYDALAKTLTIAAPSAGARAELGVAPSGPPAFTVNDMPLSLAMHDSAGIAIPWSTIQQVVLTGGGGNDL